MIVTATTKRLRVDYRIKGKTYSHQFPEGRAPENTAERSDYPYDSQDVEPGVSFTVPDNTFVQVTAYEPSEPVNTDVA